MDFTVKALGGARLIMAWNYPLTFDSFLFMCSVFLIFYSDRAFSSLCPCRDYSLEVLTSDKD